MVRWSIFSLVFGWFNGWSVSCWCFVGFSVSSLQIWLFWFFGLLVVSSIGWLDRWLVVSLVGLFVGWVFVGSLFVGSFIGWLVGLFGVFLCSFGFVH